MSKALIKVGIAGYGTVGKVRHLNADKHPDMKVVAVCDQSFGADEPEPCPQGILCHTNYHRLLEEDLDAVFVCLPNFLAPEVAIAAMGKGMHVFCEKPPGRDMDDVRAILECEARHPDLKLKFGFNHRYHDSFMDAWDVIESGRFGRVIDCRGVYGKSKIIRYGNESKDWRTKREWAGGGILLDQGIHMVDMIRCFMDDFTDVHSFVSNDYWKHDVEDNAWAIMKSSSGQVAMIHSSATQWRHCFKLDVTLERGAIILSGILSSTHSYAPETITLVDGSQVGSGDPMEQTTRYVEDKSWWREIKEFAEAIRDDTPIRVGSSAEVKKTMGLVYQIYKADADWSGQYNIR